MFLIPDCCSHCDTEACPACRGAPDAVVAPGEAGDRDQLAHALRRAELDRDAYKAAAEKLHAQNVELTLRLVNAEAVEDRLAWALFALELADALLAERAKRGGK